MIFSLSQRNHWFSSGKSAQKKHAPGLTHALEFDTASLTALARIWLYPLTWGWGVLTVLEWHGALAAVVDNNDAHGDDNKMIRLRSKKFDV